MKKIFLFLAVAGVTLFSSCEGPEGPTGYSAESQVYEITNVDFLPSSFAILYTFPQTALPSDHVLVYRLWATDSGADVWRLIPQTVYFDNGDEFDYNYDFTQYDVNIFLDGNFDLNTLGSEWSQSQIFRVVIVPGYFAKTVDTKDYKAVAKALKLEEKDVKRVQITKNK
ncbi:MAG TPA: hypothetical protein VK623_06480 [Flavobacterium sp.]|nr:hypothetical protein [Flavobacterium sp.]